MHQNNSSKLGDIHTRANAMRWMKKYTFNPLRASLSWIIVVAIACSVSWLPSVQEARNSGLLSPEGLWMLRIMILAAGLWLTEAIPAFATAMLVIALEIMFLTNAGSSNLWEWSDLLAVWGSPLIWLFFGGFLIAEAFRSVHLDALAARKLLQWSGDNFLKVTIALTLLTYVLSMFMSNTATITVVIALIAPLLKNTTFDTSRRGLLLSLAIAANLGGMVTIVGSPPNAVAVASLASIDYHVSFLKWSLMAAPLSLSLLALTFFYLYKVYFKHEKGATLDITKLLDSDVEAPPSLSKTIRRWFVLIVVLATVLMWITQALHHISPTIVVFLAITVLTTGGILTSQSLKSIPWEILILMAGGLALGKGISQSGLADYLSSLLPPSISLTVAGLIFTFFAIITSNFMSNTAAANALLPLIITVSGDSAPQMILPATFACSCAVLLPVSTPPNAICYATGYLKTKDFARLGVLFILIAPPISYAWCRLILPINP